MALFYRSSLRSEWQEQVDWVFFFVIFALFVANL